MPLPENPKMSWPPKEWEEVYNLYIEHDAWYSGDPNRLAAVYSSLIPGAYGPYGDFFYNPSAPFMGGTPRGRFWATELKEERRVMIHVPIAGDLAALSSDLLFSEAPSFIIPEAHEEKSSNDAKKAQDRLNQIIESGGVVNRLIESAESCAALGGVFIKPNWDTELAPFPIFSVAQADTAVPQFRWGFLTSVIFWKVIDEDDDVVWRLLECHEDGVILNGLYKGTRDQLGIRVGLTAHSATADLEDVIHTGIKGVAVRYIPNIKPNRRFRGSPLGMSDYSGNEGLMDALDEVFTSWMRDIRLAKARIIAPEQWLTKGEDGSLKFDIDKEVFVGVNADPLSSDKAGITMNQFAIRTEEHQKTALELMDRIITNAGYSPQSFGLKIEGRAESGTALNIRERRSFLTKAKKERYFKPAIEDVLHMMLQLDREVFRSGVTVYRPTVAFNDSVAPDITTLATAVELINRAQAASVKTKVQLLHPDWSKEQVEKEAEEILKEQGIMTTETDDLPV